MGQDPIVIYTVIPYFSDGIEIKQNAVRSFFTWQDANNYGYKLSGRYDIIPNEII